MNIGWMSAYEGLRYEKIVGGGQYVKKHGTGGEIFNFQPYRGRYCGYGRAANDTIALERLGAPPRAPFLDHVLVVWVADPRVVGWYQNARLYRECQSPPKGSNRVAPAVDGAYHATAKESDCKMLQPDARTLAVPRARDVDGGMGRYVCYAEGSQHRGFLKRLFEFIESRGKGSEKRHGSGGQGWQTDPPRRKEVEDAAVREVIRYYRTLGYDIHDCQDEKCGWDLEASTTTA